MCKCTPNVRMPFCGKPGCEWPEQVMSLVKGSGEPVTDRWTKEHKEALEKLSKHSAEGVRLMMVLLQISKDSPGAMLPADLHLNASFVKHASLVRRVLEPFDQDKDDLNKTTSRTGADHD